MVALSAVFASGLVAWALWSKPAEVQAGYFVVGISAFLYHTVLSTYQVLRAASLGSSLRHTGLLELVFITPLRPQETMLALGQGLLRPGLNATALFVLGEVLCVAILIERAAYLKEFSLGEVLAVSLWATVALWPPIQDLWAGSWLGLYQGIRQAKASRAGAITFAWVQALELVFYFVCLPIGPILSGIKSLVIFLWARDRLLFELPRIVRADTVSTGKEGGKRVFQPLPSVIPPPLPPRGA
jgi:hypothetical protein